MDNDRAVLAQWHIKNNSETLNDFCQDLTQWEEEMKRKETELLGREDSEDPKASSKPPPPRKKTKAPDKSVELEKKKGICNYDDWEKFDVDKACEEVDNDPNDKYSRSIEYKNMGNNFVRAENWEDAIKSYSKAISCNQSDATFFCNRSLCYIKTNQYELAKEDCHRALNINPKYTKALVRRAHSYIGLEKYVHAISDFKKALEIEPNNKSILSDLENTEKEYLCRPISDAEAKEITENRNQELAIILKEEGNKLVGQDEWELAISKYSQAIELYGLDPSYYANRAHCNLKCKNFQETEKDCDKALDLDEKYVKAYMRRATARKELGNYHGALSDLNQILVLEPKNALALAERDAVALLLKPATSNKKPTSPIEPGPRTQFIYKPVNLRSKKPLIRIPVRDVQSLSRAELIQGPAEEPTPRESSNISIPVITIAPDVPIVDEDTCSPSTYVQFSAKWSELQPYPDLAYKFLKLINASSFPQLVKDNLESDELVSIIKVLSSQFMKNKENVFPYLNGLASAKRFSVLRLFLTSDDRIIIENLIDYSVNNGNCTSAEASLMKESFLLK